MTQFHYITVATKPHVILDHLIDTVKNKNIQLTVLGREERRSIGMPSAGNFGLRLKLLFDFIHKPDINDYDLVLFTNAYDVLFFGNRSEIIRRYESFDSPIVFGAETICNPDSSRAIDYNNILQEEFPFLNSGMFIGRVWALRMCMMAYKYNDKDNDQRFWTTQYLQRPYLIKLDHTNRIFLNTEGIKIDRVVHDKTNEIIYYHSDIDNTIRNPLFLHFNSDDKSDLSLFLP